jgi:exopolysaccharide production protein ExoY
VFALIFFAPILLLIMLALLLFDRGPMLFRHRRIGHDGREFLCLKFRTMVVDADDRLKQLLATSSEARASWMRDQKLPNDPRITFVGKFLRVSSLDELPQFWNVLVGEMSLVGPRPITRQRAARHHWTLANKRPQRRLVSPPRGDGRDLRAQPEHAALHAHSGIHRSCCADGTRFELNLENNT